MSTQKLKSWSYSRYADYQQCPAKAKYKHIDKLKEPPAPAMERGITIHKLAEDYTLGQMKKLPKELKLFEEQFYELKKSKAKCEESWAFTNEWHETRWDDWNNCWVRIKVDAHCIDESTLYIIDHKTGKKRPEDHEEQLSLYAVSGWLKYPFITDISAQMWYLDSGEDLTRSYEIRDVQKLQKDWERKVQPMLNDTRFPPKPGNHCRWCAFSKTKGGPCRF